MGYSLLLLLSLEGPPSISSIGSRGGGREGDRGRWKEGKGEGRESIEGRY